MNGNTGLSLISKSYLKSLWTKHILLTLIFSLTRKKMLIPNVILKYNSLRHVYEAVNWRSDDTLIFVQKLFKIQLVNIVQSYLNQHRKCIKMSTNKPMFGPVVLEIANDFLHVHSNSHVNVNTPLALRILSNEPVVC